MSDAAAAAGLLAAAVALFLVGRHTRAVWGAVIGAAGVAALQVGASSDEVVPLLLVSVTPVVAGMAIRSRDLVAGELGRRAAELEAERDLYAELAVRYERTRLASELHDIVAHAMSVMVVQASAGQRLAVAELALAADAFAAISESARQAETDMQRLVELLADETAIHSPDLAVVEELVRRAAGGGLDVTLRLEGVRGGLDAAAVEVTYAIVRESLTNALRYAAGAPVAVRVDGAGEELLVEVVNGQAPRSASLTGHGTGSGLGGLRERVVRARGRFAAGPTQDGGWQVVARMPRQATPALSRS